MREKGGGRNLPPQTAFFTCRLMAIYREDAAKTDIRFKCDFYLNILIPTRA
jgi:hypothetical protein